jgi:DNA-binding winged helix-turn-helix (wHTH) protein
VARIFEIGRFRLDAEVGVLRDGRPTALGIPAVALPTALIERANAFVPKASLLDAAWPNAVVEQDNVADADRRDPP